MGKNQGRAEEGVKEPNMLGQQRRDVSNEGSLGFNTHFSAFEGEKASAHLSFTWHALKKGLARQSRCFWQVVSMELLIKLEKSNAA